LLKLEKEKKPAAPQRHVQGTPQNRLCRAAGVVPWKGVGAATRSARRLGVI
jgi:hypothetical protein